MRQLEFGWYLPTNGDTTSFNDPNATVPPSARMMERIILAAEAAGFEYILIPVVNYCWKAVVIASYLIAKTRHIKPLIAAKPGYVNPVLFAKTMATLDQMTQGRLAINLIAGQAESDFKSDGISYSKEQRYALMAEEVAIMKMLWGSTETIDFNGEFHTLTQASIVPENISKLQTKAVEHGRAGQLGFGMRLQIMCRESEQDAWDAAHRLIANSSDANRQAILDNTFNSVANQ